MTDSEDLLSGEEKEFLDEAFGGGYQVHRFMPPDALLSPSAEEVCEREQMADVLRGALGCLTERQAQVIRLRYGLEDGVERTQEAAAKSLGITQQTLAGHEMAALKSLRFNLFRG